jgi:hypothetical protein
MIPCSAPKMNHGLPDRLGVPPPLCEHRRYVEVLRLRGAGAFARDAAEDDDVRLGRRRHSHCPQGAVAHRQPGWYGGRASGTMSESAIVVLFFVRQKMH